MDARNHSPPSSFRPLAADDQQQSISNFFSFSNASILARGVGHRLSYPPNGRKNYFIGVQRVMKTLSWKCFLKRGKEQMRSSKAVIGAMLKFQPLKSRRQTDRARDNSPPIHRWVYGPKRKSRVRDQRCRWDGRPDSFAPDGAWEIRKYDYPAMNLLAIIDRPCGTSCRV